MTYAIVKIAGKQYKVEVGSEIKVDRINSDSVKADVVLVSENGKLFIKKGEVSCSVVSQTRNKKIVGAKFKQRKRQTGYFGHKQDMTIIKVDSITV